MAAIKGVMTTIEKRKFCEAHAGVRALPKITQMAWGDGGVDENGTPKAVTGEETEMYNELLRKDVDEPIFVNEEHTIARYGAVLEDNDLVGKEISEIALIDEDGEIAEYGTFMKKGKDEGMPQKYEVDEIFI